MGGHIGPPVHMVLFVVGFDRKTIRLMGYDYSSSGSYFVTLDLQDKINRFWSVGADRRVCPLNEIGQMVDYWWREIEKHFVGIGVNTYVIMPDHFHGVLQIDKSKTTLSGVIQWFKTMTTNEYIKNVKNNNWPRFYKRLWQRNYYEHIIRNKADYERIREYIINNPSDWKVKDENNNNQHQS